VRTTSGVVSILLGFGPALPIVGLLVFFMQGVARSGGGLGVLGSFGRIKARRIDPSAVRITLADPAGIDQAKSELSEMVDFLLDPARHGRLGARIPHGSPLRPTRDR
jgi:cell division protease FtsH